MQNSVSEFLVLLAPCHFTKRLLDDERADSIPPAQHAALRQRELHHRDAIPCNCSDNRRAMISSFAT